MSKATEHTVKEDKEIESWIHKMKSLSTRH